MTIQPMEFLPVDVSSVRICRDEKNRALGWEPVLPEPKTKDPLRRALHQIATFDEPIDCGRAEPTREQLWDQALKIMRIAIDTLRDNPEDNTQ